MSRWYLPIIGLLSCFCMLLVCGDSAFPQEVMRTIAVRLDLFHRTYPKPDRIRTVDYPGYVLYPGYSDLQGVITFAGPKEFVDVVQKEVTTAQHDSEALARLLWVAVKREVPGKGYEDLPYPLKGMEVQLTPGEGLAKTDNTFGFRFRIPVELGTIWKEGRYALTMGKWYRDGEARKSLESSLCYFEVKKLVKGTGDEINLLTNVWFFGGGPRGIGEELLRRKEYEAEQLITRVLQIDPNDAWAKHELAQYSMRIEGEPETAVKMYTEIIADLGQLKAHRIIGLLDPYLQPPRAIAAPTSQDLEKHAQRKLEDAQRMTKASREAESEVQRLAQRKGEPALLALIRTDGGKNLWSKDDVWPAIRAIRYIRSHKVKAAHQVLVRELSKLPHQDGLFQRELLNALSAIYSVDKKIEPSPLFRHQYARSIIEWWLAHPIPASMQKHD